MKIKMSNLKAVSEVSTAQARQDPVGVRIEMSFSDAVALSGKMLLGFVLWGAALSGVSTVVIFVVRRILG